MAHNCLFRSRRKGVAFVGKGNSNGVQNESAAARETSDGNLSHVTSGQVEDGKHVAFGPDVTPSAPYNHDGRNAGPIDGKPPRPSRSRRSSGAGGQGIRRSHASSPPGSVAGIERSRKSRVRFEDEPEDSRDRELLRERSTQGRNKTIGTLTSWQLIAADVMKEVRNSNATAAHNSSCYMLRSPRRPACAWPPSPQLPLSSLPLLFLDSRAPAVTPRPSRSCADSRPQRQRRRPALEWRWQPLKWL